MFSSDGAFRPPRWRRLADWVDQAAELDGADVSEAECLDLVRSLEEAKSALAAAQARVTASLHEHRRCREQAAGVPRAKRCAGVGAEVALARRVSPVQGNRYVGFALALSHEMPHTHAALAAGQISEWKATLVVRETAVLSREHRCQVDRELAGHLPRYGDRRAAAAARAIGYRLDPASAIRRTRKAVKDRRVSLRPAPDTMSLLTGLLPVAQGVACKVALERHADQLKSAGDERTRGQIMADTLVERVTGQARADGTPVEVELQMSDRTLFGAGTAAGDAPAHLHGYGPIPAAVARALVRAADRAWVRRLYTDPESGELVAMDGRRRCFSGQLRHFLVLRDQTCRTPWCDAPIRHADHARRHAEGGSTSAANGDGLCAACNFAKERPGWETRLTTLPGGTTVLDITTPTGHRHRSRAPAPPGIPSRLERRLVAVV